MAKTLQYEFNGGTATLIDDGKVETLIIDTPDFKYEGAIAHEVYVMTPEQREAAARQNWQRFLR